MVRESYSLGLPGGGRLHAVAGGREGGLVARPPALGACGLAVWLPGVRRVGRPRAYSACLSIPVAHPLRPWWGGWWCASRRGVPQSAFCPPSLNTHVE